jgi:hypothetical protein
MPGIDILNRSVALSYVMMLKRCANLGDLRGKAYTKDSLEFPLFILAVTILIIC